jgi:methionyl-tRNA formyltransferase
MKHAVFMGSDTFSTPALSALIEGGELLLVPVRLVGVVTQPDRPAGRGRRLTASPVKTLAEAANVPVLQPQSMRGPEAVEEVLSLRPDIIVVASYGQILPRVLLDTPPNNAINLHPSLLPRYRGSAPIPAPILAGDSGTGTTLMLMSSKMDAGPILDQRAVEIGPQETGGELSVRLARLSAQLLMDKLPAWLSGEIEPRPQDESLATYTQRVSKSDGEIDWSLSADEIWRRVRAFSPWPGAYSYWNGRQVTFLQVEAGDGDAVQGSVEPDGSSLAVGTGRGLLRVYRLQIAGGRPVTAAEFLRGHADILGSVLGR